VNDPLHHLNYACDYPQIREETLVPDLYVLTVESAAYIKKRLKREKKINFILCNFSVRTLQCKKNFKKYFFAHEKLKKPPKKVAHNRPKPFYFTVQPRTQPTAQN
jgi:hypothetical protein